jgi:tetratricopeptide (TPR) repeat protein
MLRPKKKISKRELKEDTLVKWYAEATGFYEKHKRNIHIVITAVVVVVLALVVYLKNRSDNNEMAMAQLGKVTPLFDAGSYQPAVDGVAERNIPGLRSIVDNYGGTPSGELARFYLATSLYELRRYEEALEQFKDFSASDEVLVISRYAGMAQCEEALGKYREAAENFEKAAVKNSRDVSAAENLHHAAQNFALAGDKEKALELFKRLKKNYPLTTYGRDADRYISALSV